MLSGETMKKGGAIFALQGPGPPQGNLVIRMSSSHVFDKRRQGCYIIDCLANLSYIDFSLPGRFSKPCKTAVYISKRAAGWPRSLNVSKLISSHIPEGIQTEGLSKSYTPVAEKEMGLCSSPIGRLPKLRSGDYYRCVWHDKYWPTGQKSTFI